MSLIAHDEISIIDLPAVLMRLFERVNRLGTTVLIASHDTGFVNRFGHSRFHLDQGMLQSAEAVAQ